HSPGFGSHGVQRGGHIRKLAVSADIGVENAGQPELVRPQPTSVEAGGAGALGGGAPIATQLSYISDADSERVASASWAAARPGLPPSTMSARAGINQPLRIKSSPDRLRLMERFVRASSALAKDIR